MSKAKKYYTVWKGRTPGVYDSWDECKANTHGVACQFKSFRTQQEAQDAFDAGYESYQSQAKEDATTPHPTHESKASHYQYADPNGVRHWIPKGVVIDHAEGCPFETEEPAIKTQHMLDFPDKPPQDEIAAAYREGYAFGYSMASGDVDAGFSAWAMSNFYHTKLNPWAASSSDGPKDCPPVLRES